MAPRRPANQSMCWTFRPTLTLVKRFTCEKSDPRRVQKERTGENAI